jgi:hypothetical protein
LSVHEKIIALNGISYAAKTYCEPSGLELPEPIVSECDLKWWEGFNCRARSIVVVAGMLAAAAMSIAKTNCDLLRLLRPGAKNKKPIKLRPSTKHQVHTSASS